LDNSKSILLEKKIDYIELLVNVSGDKLKELYCKAKIFWYLCGLDQTDPALVEHFGMTIVEAMENKLVPIVFDGGGQREIVDHGECGYRVKNIFHLIKYTYELIRDEKKREQFIEKSVVKSKLYSRERFESNFKEYFTELIKEYREFKKTNEN